MFDSLRQIHFAKYTGNLLVQRVGPTTNYISTFNHLLLTLGKGCIEKHATLDLILAYLRV